jgi:hypothetical protein
MKTQINVVAMAVALVCGSALAADESGRSPELLLSGPVEKIDRATDSVTVFGREFSAENASELSPSETVNVYGTLQSDGSITDAKLEPTATFASGGDPVYLKGVVTDSDSALGQIKIGDTIVDYTQQLGSATFTIPTVGQVVEVQGTQPMVKGVLLASAVGKNVVSKFNVPGHASSTLATQGSGIRSAATQGSGVHSAATQGSGVYSAATQGSGVYSAATQGSGVYSAATQGSGVYSAATQGSGVYSAATQGSGVYSAATQGSGVYSAATQGSGVHSTATQGSGVYSAATQGSGVHSAATQGSGVHSAATQGSGVYSAATQGSGVHSAATQGSGIAVLATQGSGSAR